MLRIGPYVTIDAVRGTLDDLQRIWHSGWMGTRGVIEQIQQLWTEASRLTAESEAAAERAKAATAKAIELTLSLQQGDFSPPASPVVPIWKNSNLALEERVLAVMEAAEKAKAGEIAEMLHETYGRVYNILNYRRHPDGNYYWFDRDEDGNWSLSAGGQKALKGLKARLEAEGTM